MQLPSLLLHHFLSSSSQEPTPAARSVSKERVGIMYERGGKAQEGRETEKCEAVSLLSECSPAGCSILLKE